MDIVRVLSLNTLLALSTILALLVGLVPGTLDRGTNLLELATVGFHGKVDVERGEWAVGAPKMPADIQDMSIPGGPKGHIDIRIIRPKDSTEALPVVMYFHGGGWMAGNKDTHDRFVRELANKANAAVVFVEYSLSPRVTYPVPIEEAYHATEYIANNGKQLNLDPSRLAVAGDSSGGNMAAVMAILAKQRNGPKIAYQVLIYPVTDANFDTPSYRRYGTGYLLDRDMMKLFWDNYLPDIEARKQPMASPLQASTDQLKGLPPALVITAEQDVLRDEGESYVHKLTEAGVPVKGVLYPGMIHGFVLNDSLVDTPATHEAIDLASDMLRKTFTK